MIPTSLLVISQLSQLSVIISGIAVMATGDWHRLGLKFACVCFSTISAIFMLSTALFLDQSQFCAINSVLCVSGGAHAVALNLALTGFHVAVGRDAIRIKNADRRRHDEAWIRK